MVNIQTYECVWICDVTVRQETLHLDCPHPSPFLQQISRSGKVWQSLSNWVTTTTPETTAYKSVAG